MRFDSTQQLTAHKVVNTYTERQIADLIHQYGEERAARRIARAIVRERPVDTTTQLAEIVAGSVRRRPGSRIHPATRTFQAIRMTVNKELDNLKSGLEAAVRILAAPGRLAVISYHSLEDRMVKNFLRLESLRCVCPPITPTCVCSHTPRLKPVNKRVIKPVRDRDLHQPSKPQRPSARGRKVISMMSHYSRIRRHGPFGSRP